MNDRVIMTKTAATDLQEIAFSIAERTGERETAKVFTEAVRKRCRTLSDFPDRGSFPDDYLLRSAGYRFLAEGKYLIFYCVEEEKKNVYVTGIIHSGRDYKHLLKNRL